MTQFILPKYMPLPVPKQYAMHQVARGLSHPVRPFFATPNPPHGHNSVAHAPVNSSSFECSCGANPLNDPHNLAVAAGAYQPLTAAAYPLDLSIPNPLAYAPKITAGLLFSLLPAQLQKELCTPMVVDNLRSVGITNPESPLLPMVFLLWPENYKDQTNQHNHAGHEGFDLDTFFTEDWDAWNTIHREDSVLMNPGPAIKAQADQWKPNIDAPNSKLNKPPRPGPGLERYHPALPVTHTLMWTKGSTPSSYCWCGTQAPEDSHRRHVYAAFVGRTIARAMEIHTLPWQESMLGKYHMGSKFWTTPPNAVNDLYDLMKEN